MTRARDDLAAVVIAGLAATRAIRAWRYESIGQPMRRRIVDWTERPVKRGGRLDVKATARREWIGELIQCSHCLGTHASILAVILLRTRLAWLVRGFAAAWVLSAIFDRADFDDPDDVLFPAENVS